MSREHAPLPRRLLIVQRNEAVGRALARFFAPFVAEVATLTSPAEAERRLAEPSALPTDVICGIDFGPGDPPGTEWIRRYRAALPLGKLVIASSSPPERCDDADLIVGKPIDPRAILDFFYAAAGGLPAARGAA
jgi:hypothetical protein